MCGQNDRDYLRSLFPVLYQILAETFEADSRVWRTLAALFLHPGFLSLEFSRNRRAHYLSPFRLYLFTSLMFFLVLSLTVEREGGDAEGPGLIQVGASEDDKDDAQASLDFGIEANAEAIETLKRSLGEERAGKIDQILARPDWSVPRTLLIVNAKWLGGETRASTNRSTCSSRVNSWTCSMLPQRWSGIVSSAICPLRCSSCSRSMH